MSVAGRTASHTSIRPRPLYSVSIERRRSRRVAEDVCAGRFTHAGLTVDVGVEPDWLGAALPADEEWRIEWSKFAWGLDLAHASGVTGEPRFQEAWERFVSSWIEQVPVGFDASEVTARRLQHWLSAWQLFAAAPGFRGLAEGLEGALVESVAEQAAFVRTHLTPERNHRTLELYALFAVALAFPELDAGGELLAFALAELAANLHADFRPDGVHRESSTHYHLLALRSLLEARENARRFAVAVPDGYDDALERACEFALHCHRPDGGIPALSDADGEGHRDLLALAAGLLERPDFLYAATSGASGRLPRRRSVDFPAGGYFVQRSGWGQGSTPFERERFLIFDCGPLGDGGHGHYDLLSFEAAADGRPLVVDPGRYTYAEGEPNLRRWFKSTAAHNTVCVDGLDQTPYRRGKPKGPTAAGSFDGRVRGPGLDLLCGVATSPCYDAVHTRRIAFVAGEYWLVEDRLCGETPHRYDLRFHLAPDAWQATRIDSRPSGAVVRAPGVALVFAPGLEPRLEDGWVSPEYGVKLPAPVVSAAVEGRADAWFLTALVPLAADEPSPELTVRREARGTVVEVERERTHDTVCWGVDGARMSRRARGRSDS